MDDSNLRSVDVGHERHTVASACSRIVQVCSWFALVAALFVCVVMSLSADHHWLGTLLAFGPRWLLLVPITVCSFAAVCVRRGALIPLGIAGVVVLGPVMSLCIPWRTAVDVDGSGTRVKIITCNTLLGRADQRLDELIANEQPDVVVLQEWPRRRQVPSSLVTGWSVVRDGQVVVASRWPIASSQLLKSPTASHRTIGVQCELEAPCGTLHLFGLHLLTPREGLEAMLSKRLGGLPELEDVTKRRELDSEAASNWIASCPGTKLVAGDLNLTPESLIYRRRFGNLQNAFSIAGWGWGGTKFTRIHSVRIDHILTDNAWQITRCVVGEDVGSDHRPLIAEVVLRRE